MSTRPHCVPIGGQEPNHVCSEGCWCFPLVDESGYVTHNAKDCREARERLGRARKDEMWAIIDEEVLP